LENCGKIVGNSMEGTQLLRNIATSKLENPATLRNTATWQHRHTSSQQTIGRKMIFELRKGGYGNYLLVTKHEDGDNFDTGDKTFVLTHNQLKRLNIAMKVVEVFNAVRTEKPVPEEVKQTLEELDREFRTFVELGNTQGDEHD